MARARKLLVGHRVGSVPREVGQPPIVHDFRESAERLRITLDGMQFEEAVLDLYRKTQHRESSRFFHRLRFLDVPFAEWKRGPDFVLGKNLDRIQEVWQYRWSPATESTLIEKALYGSTLEEASASLLIEHFTEAESEGKGRRADIGTMLLLDACRMGLHKHTQDLLYRTQRMVAEDSSFISLVGATMNLLLLHMSREPLQAHHLDGLKETAETAFSRASYLLPGLAATPTTEERATIDCLNAFTQVPDHLGSQPEHKDMLWDRLSQLASAASGNAAIRGAACGLLFSDGKLSASDLVQRLRGHLLSPKDQSTEGVTFLSGILMTARSVLWQVPEIIETVTDILSDWSEEEFVSQIPNLRLAFSDLMPRECDRVAGKVADYLGVGRMRLLINSEFTEADVLAGAEINRSVLQTLERDGLLEWMAGD